MTQDVGYLGECLVVLHRNAQSVSVGWDLLEIPISSYCLVVFLGPTSLLISRLAIPSVAECACTPVKSTLEFENHRPRA